jgi:hypothetical protein
MRSLIILTIMMASVGGWLYVNETDYRDAVARETARRELRNWLARNCIPQRAHERAVIEVRQDGSTQCAMYQNAGHGRAPKLVFAEVRE